MSNDISTYKQAKMHRKLFLVGVCLSFLFGNPIVIHASHSYIVSGGGLNKLVAGGVIGKPVKGANAKAEVNSNVAAECNTPCDRQSNVYNVRNFGAVGDGVHLDHTAINAAIDTCAAHGGGQVWVPAGRYLCGSIHLKSNIDLHIALGARIMGAPQSMKAYDLSETFEGTQYQDGGHTYFHNSLIWGEKLHHVSITGFGIIDGGDLTKQDKEKNVQIEGGSVGMGDKAIAMKLCRSVNIHDITILHGGHFAIILTGCDIVDISNVNIDTNRDGIDIDCCTFTTISNCKVNSPNDDGIVLKSSYALQRPVGCDNILITNCAVMGYKEGTYYDGTLIPGQAGWGCGRIKLGTESNGGFHNITISNCSFVYCCGLALEEVDQGEMNDIVVTNITMNHVRNYPIYITTGCRNRGPKECTNVSKGSNIQISNVTADDVDSFSGIQITGMKDYPLCNIRLSNIQINYRGGGTKEESLKEFPELGTIYPEPRKLGRCTAYSLYARHVEGLHLDHITFKAMTPDYRPSIIMDDVDGVDIDHVSVPVGKDLQANRFVNVRNIEISSSKSVKGSMK
jgi:polygalacturonase